MRIGQSIEPEIALDPTLIVYDQLAGRARFIGGNARVPLMIIAIGSGAQIASALPELGALLPQPLITLERVQVCKRQGELLDRPRPVTGRDRSGLPIWQKLMIYTSQSASHEGRSGTGTRKFLRL